MLAVPLVSEGQALGVIVIRRSEAGPFSPAQVSALESFAYQAAIAIGHARLFQEVAEALERERATGAILRVIASSPTTVDPVFDAILDSALRLCASPVGNLLLFDGEAFRLVAHRGLPGTFIEAWRQPHKYGSHTGPTRAITERQPVQIMDLMADRAYAERDPVRVQAVELLGARTSLFVPMFKDGTPVGVIVTWRRDVRAFSEAQIQLLSTFADQAVIALENVRLFTELAARNRELTDALERERATGEVLGAINASPTAVEPVFETILASAMRLCDVPVGLLFLYENDVVRLAAHRGAPATFTERIRTPRSLSQLSPGVGLGRAMADRRPIHVLDTLADPAYAEGTPARAATVEGARRPDDCVGTPAPRRRAGGRHLHLATRGARVHRRRDQPAGDVRRPGRHRPRERPPVHGARGPEPRADRGARAADGHVRDPASHLQVADRCPTGLRSDRPERHPVVRGGRRWRLSIRWKPGPPGGRVRYDSADCRCHRTGLALSPSRGTATGRAILTRAVVHVDVANDPEYTQGVLIQAGFRTVLAVPMLRDGDPIGAIGVTGRRAAHFPTRRSRSFRRSPTRR